MNREHHYLLSWISLLLSSSPIQAINADSAIGDWQERRLMQPSADELKWEQAGNIMIYDGLTDRLVSKAMDKHFHRIGSMTSAVIRYRTQPRVSSLRKTTAADNRLIISQLHRQRASQPR
jgi:hypothetical protein